MNATTERMNNISTKMSERLNGRYSELVMYILKIGVIRKVVVFSVVFQVVMRDINNITNKHMSECLS